VQLDVAVREVVAERLLYWYRALAFDNGSVVTTTGFAILDVLDNVTTERLKDSITDTLLRANDSFVVDRNTILITRDFAGRSTQPCIPPGVA